MLDRLFKEVLNNQHLAVTRSIKSLVPRQRFLPGYQGECEEFMLVAGSLF
jgi:hypothetical protein